MQATTPTAAFNPEIYKNLHPLHRLWFTKPDLLAGLIILLFFCLRLWFISTGQLNLLESEAQYWDWARHPQWSYYSKGPLIAWIISFWRNLFGDVEFAVRIGAVFNSTLTQVALYWGLSRRFKSSNLALSSLILACLCPLFFASSIFMTSDSPLLLCWIMALLALDLAIEKKDENAPLIILAACMSFGVLADYLMLFMMVIALVYCLILHSLRLLPAHYASRISSALVCGASLGLLPIVLWNVQNNWLGLKHLKALIKTGAPKNILNLPKFFDFLGGQFFSVLPWIFILIVFGVLLAYQRLKAARARVQGLEQLGLSTDFSMPFPANESLALRRDALFIAASLPLWLIFCILSLRIRMHVSWVGMSYVGGLVLAALGLIELLKRYPLKANSKILVPVNNTNNSTDNSANNILGEALNPALEPNQAQLDAKTPFGRKVFVPCVVLSLIIFGLAHFQAFFSLPEAINPMVRAKNWELLGERLEEIRKSLPNPNKVFFFSSSEGISAKLAFYAPDQPKTYCLSMPKNPRRISQYDLWETPNGDVVNLLPPVPIPSKKIKRLGEVKTAETDALLKELEQGKDDGLLMPQTSPRYGWSAVFVEYSNNNWSKDLLLKMFESGEHQVFSGATNGEAEPQLGLNFDLMILHNFNGKWVNPVRLNY